MIQTKNDVLRLGENINYLKLKIRDFTEENFNELIQIHWDELKEITAKEKLKKMPVDIISTLESGIPINRLVAHGYEMIADLEHETRNDLMKVDGVGEVTGFAIYEAVSKIKKSVYKEVTPKINPDDLSKKDIALLESIHMKWMLLETGQEIAKEITRFEREVEEPIKIAKSKKGFLGSLFQSKLEKEKIQLAIETLNKKSKSTSLHKLQADLTKLLQYTVNPERLKQEFIESNAKYYTEIEKVVGFDPTGMTDDLPNDIVDAIHAFPLDTTNLKVDLRHYQTFGAKYALHYERTLLGDEMGLGKTIQALALINHLFQKGEMYSIVVCPLSVLANWKREIEQHSTLNTFVFHGNQRETEFAKWQAEKGVLLTTYEHTLHLKLENQLVDVLIVDEAHYIKNPEARRSKSVYALAELANYALFMSGTPIENRLEEMKQLISVLQPEIAHSLSKELHFLEPRAFRKTVAPVYLRRNRKDVLAELPELEVIPQWMDFGIEEQKEYEQAVSDGQLMLMRRAAWLGKTPEKSPKLQKLLDICEEANQNGHKVLIFSFFRDVIRTVQSHLGDRTFEAISGDVPTHRRQEIIDEFTKAKPGAVLVSQITAGGVGLNIQAANIVILCEPQWKPSIEEQAISRAYRMGQSRNVVVYRLLTEDSIDVSMLEVLGQKAGLFDLYARESEVAELAMNDTDEEESMKSKVLQLEKERIKQRAL